MKCMRRRVLKGMVLGGILIIGISLQSTKALAAGVNASNPVVAEAQVQQPASSATNQNSEGVVRNRNYVWTSNYATYTIRVKVNLKTIVKKEVAEYNPCNIDICKLICSCEEREKFEKYLCENLLYADGTIEITLTNGCGRVVYRYVKPIHQDNRHR